ncbi:MAG: hypothetical protein HOW73_15305 [Polyangiaceae bacterium]|nr:hypothetical protein [Polyangiaceae bacterium]
MKPRTNGSSSRIAAAIATFCLAAGAAGCSGPSHVKGGPFTGDPANFTYDLDGKEVTLKSGAAEERTGDKPDDVIATDLTGARIDADFDGDDGTDCAVVVTRDAGPLKVHYLAVIRGGSSDAMTVSLGKNVLVKNLAPDPKGGVIVTMLVHDKDVPEADPPTVEVKKVFSIKTGKLVATGGTGAT